MRIERIPGEGGDGALGKDWFTHLQEECETLRQYASDEGVLEKRQKAEAVRHALGEQQNFDERLYRKDEADGKSVLFDGQSDLRHRESDLIVNIRVALDVLAVLRADMMIVSGGSNAAKRASLVKQVLQWVVRTRIGSEWLRQWTLLSQYRNADEPAAGLMQVSWRRERELEPQKVTIEQVSQAYAAARVAELGFDEGAPAEEELAMAVEMAADEFEQIVRAGPDDAEAVGTVVGALEQMLGYTQGKYPKLMRTAAKDLIRDGDAEAPGEVVVYDGPILKALRLWEDAYVPPGTTDFRDCPFWFKVEWVSASEAWGRVERGDWEAAFARELVGDDSKMAPGHSTAMGYEAEPIFHDATETDKQRYARRYQVAVAYFRAVNASGMAARYYVTFRPGIEKPAHERRLLRTGTRGWNAVLFSREVLTKWVTDSRGIPWLSKGTQGVNKRMLDLMHNAGALGALPPVLSRNRRGQGDLFLEMLGEIPLKTGGDVAFMEPPKMPEQITFLVERLERFRDQYWGILGDRPTQEGEALRQMQTAWWMAQVSSVVKLLWQEIQYNMDDATLEQVTNARGRELQATRDQIAGMYEFSLAWDARELDPEFLATLGGIIKDTIVPLDRNAMVDTAPVVRGLLERAWPQVGAEAMRDAEQAQEDEVAAEMRNYALIRAGVRPPFVEDGSWNYELRANVYRQMAEENPDVFEDMAPDKRMLLSEWLQSLDHLARQFGENVDIGRRGAQQTPAPTMPGAGGEP